MMFQTALITILAIWSPQGTPTPPADVPASHWARAAVLDVTSRGVIAPQNGHFAGASKVTRRELALTLAQGAL